MSNNETAVTFDSAGFRLCGILTAADVPAGRGIVLLHGWGGYRIGPHRILVRAARELAREGWNVLRFDHHGRGDSEGDGTTANLDGMIQDALSAVDFMKIRTDARQIALLGICSGSNVAIGAATLRPELGPLALWSVLPFQPEQQAEQRVRRARHYLKEYARKAMRPETWARMLRGEVSLRGVTRTVAGERTPSAEGRNLKDSSRDIMEALAGYRGRMLFVTGSDDPEGMAGRNLFQSLASKNNTDAHFHLIEGATHSFYHPDHAEEALRATHDFLNTEKKP